MTSDRSSCRLALLALLPALACSQAPPARPPTGAETRSTRAADLRDTQALLLLLADQKRFEETVFVALLDSSKSVRLDLAVTLGRIGDVARPGDSAGTADRHRTRRAAGGGVRPGGARRAGGRPGPAAGRGRRRCRDRNAGCRGAREAPGAARGGAADPDRPRARGGRAETRAGALPLQGGWPGRGRGRNARRAGPGARRNRSRARRARRRGLRSLSRRPPRGAAVPAPSPRGSGPEDPRLGGARTGRCRRARGLRRAGAAARRSRAFAPHPGSPGRGAHCRADGGGAATRLGKAPRRARRRPLARRPRHRSRIVGALDPAGGGSQGRAPTPGERRAARARARAPGARRGGRSGGARMGGARCGRPGAGAAGARRRGGGEARARRSGGEAGARSGADGPGGGRRGPALRRR